MVQFVFLPTLVVGVMQLEWSVSRGEAEMLELRGALSSAREGGDADLQLLRTALDAANTR